MLLHQECFIVPGSLIDTFTSYITLTTTIGCGKRSLIVTYINDATDIKNKNTIIDPHFDPQRCFDRV